MFKDRKVKTMLSIQTIVGALKHQGSDYKEGPMLHNSLNSLITVLLHNSSNSLITDLFNQS